MRAARLDVLPIGNSSTGGRLDVDLTADALTTGADLTAEVDLTAMDLAAVDLPAADSTPVNLRGVDFIADGLTAVDLTAVDLTGVELGVGGST